MVPSVAKKSIRPEGTLIALIALVVNQQHCSDGESTSMSTNFPPSARRKARARKVLAWLGRARPSKAEGVIPCEKRSDEARIVGQRRAARPPVLDRPALDRKPALLNGQIA